MSVITINDVLNGVLSRLASVYPNTALYTEETGQAFDPPSFLVYLSPGDQKRLVNRRYRRTYTVVVKYFQLWPDGGGNAIPVQSELYGVAETLYDILRVIPVSGGTISGEAWTHEITEGILQFTAEYAVDMLDAVETVAKMAEFKQEVRIHNEG